MFSPWTLICHGASREMKCSAMLETPPWHRVLHHTSQVTLFPLSVCLFEGCVLVVSVIEQLAQWHNSTVKAATERLCSYIPGKYPIMRHMFCWFCYVSLLIKNSHVEPGKALSTSRTASQMDDAERQQGVTCREVSGMAKMALELGFHPKVRVSRTNTYRPLPSLFVCFVSLLAA